jgi:hypothetical protein
MKNSIESNIHLLKLIDSGINYVKASFSGGGDDGDIDEISYHYESDSDEVPVPENFDETAFRDFLYQLIDRKMDTVGDWINNGGGGGTMLIDLETSTYSMNAYLTVEENYDWDEEYIFD